MASWCRNTYHSNKFSQHTVRLNQTLTLSTKLYRDKPLLGTRLSQFPSLDQAAVLTGSGVAHTPFPPVCYRQSVSAHRAAAARTRKQTVRHSTRPMHEIESNNTCMNDQHSPIWQPRRLTTTQPGSYMGTAPIHRHGPLAIHLEFGPNVHSNCIGAVGPSLQSSYQPQPVEGAERHRCLSTSRQEIHTPTPCNNVRSVRLNGDSVGLCALRHILLLMYITA
jgi:hypothetical protein